MKVSKVAFIVCMVAVFVGAFLVVGHSSAARAQVQIPINVVSTAWVTYASDGSMIQIDGLPGDTKIPLRVKIQNIGNATISGVSAYLLLDYPFRNTTGGNLCRSFYSTSMSPGTSAEMDFIMNIDLNAKPDEYRLRMTFSYLEVATGVGKTLYFLRTLDTIAPAVVSPAKVMVIYDIALAPPITVPAGNITVAGNVLNTGKVSAYNTNISIASPILGRPSATIVGQVDPNIPRPFSFRLQLRPGVAVGTYPIVISCSFADYYGVSHISQYQVRVVVRQPEPPRPTTTERPSDPLSVLVQIIRDILTAFFGIRVIAPV